MGNSFFPRCLKQITLLGSPAANVALVRRLDREKKNINRKERIQLSTLTKENISCALDYSPQIACFAAVRSTELSCGFSAWLINSFP